VTAILTGAIAPAPASAEDVPAEPSRYSLAGGCYALEALSDGGFVAKAGDGYSSSATGAGAAEPFSMRATDLGEYLLYDRDGEFLAARSGDGVESMAIPSPDAEWRVAGRARFRLTNLGRGAALAVGADRDLVQGPAATFGFTPAHGCARFPEVQLNVEGAPFRGATPFQQVKGMVDAHNHTMAFEFLGGRLHCGRPWHRYGVPHALVDCPDHAAGGIGAVIENFFATGTPVGTHDPIGWPTFKDWPRWDSLTHEGTYYRWIERAWRGGLRILVPLMVEQGLTCEVYPLKKNSCSELESARLQIKRTYEFQDYIDAQEGGPGKGWFRIVRNPFEARRVINAGKLAVILGIEETKPFDCGIRNGRALCGRADVRRHLAEAYSMGVRQMELLNQFDNAFGGVAGQPGALGVVANTGNRIETGRFLDLETCTTPEGVEDNAQVTGHEVFGAVLSTFLPPATVPVYPAPPHCNRYGLSDIGAYTVRRMMDRGMIIDPDHMSVLARSRTLDIIEAERYGGVISSHSWSDPIAYQRILRLGGMVTPIGDPVDDVVEKWRDLRSMRNRRYLYGFGFGSDINGISSQAGPRGGPDPVRYPFRLFGTTLDRQRSGERVFDINRDGIAHFGLYPDWVADLRNVAGPKIVRDLGRGAEAYLQMWERAVGVPHARCLPKRAKLSARGLGRLRIGDSTTQVLRRAGQPERRIGRAYRYCVAGSRKAAVKATFDGRGRLKTIKSTAPGHTRR
jgi:microsomal dipeptidase-like Zn-dependent dipeptidase